MHKVDSEKLLHTIPPLLCLVTPPQFSPPNEKAAQNIEVYFGAVGWKSGSATSPESWRAEPLLPVARKRRSGGLYNLWVFLHVLGEVAYY